MATKLTSKLTRESIEKADDREILVTLTEEQTVSLKLKGMKTGTVSIGIKELWDYLKGIDVEKPKRAPAKINAGETMVPLSRLRSINRITPGSLELANRMDEMLSGFIDQ